MEKRDSELLKIMGRRVKDLRLKHKLHQEYLAYALSLNRVSICNIEAGKQGLTPENILKCCMLFKCKLEDLFPSDHEYKARLYDYKDSSKHDAALKKSKIKDKIRALRLEMKEL